MRVVKASAWPFRSQLLLPRYASTAASQATSNNSPSSSGAHKHDTNTRRTDHNHQTTHPKSESYELTLHTDDTHREAVIALRNQYFPPIFTKTAAQIILFRTLPGSELASIESAIQDVVRHQRPFTLATGKAVRHTGGLALDVHAAQARIIFGALRARWRGFLSEQDRNFRPLYVFQNQVEDKGLLQETFEEIRKNFAISGGTVTGLRLYLYAQGGDWVLRGRYPFQRSNRGNSTASPPQVTDGKLPALANYRRLNPYFRTTLSSPALATLLRRCPPYRKVLSSPL